MEGYPIDWTGRPVTGPPDPNRLLKAASASLDGGQVDLVVVDMPVGIAPITGRRIADNAVSQSFGAAHCGTHSPNAVRPGRLGQSLSDGFAQHGFSVATAQVLPGSPGHLVEVYPHPALLRLLSLTERFPYKLSRRNRYWPNDSPATRKRRLITHFHRIRDALDQRISGIDLPLPSPEAEVPFARLKVYEDALDALICGWVGICYTVGQAEPFGNEEAAIWIPCANAGQ